MHTHSKLYLPPSPLKLPLRRKSSASVNFVASALKIYDTHEGKGESFLYKKLVESALKLPSYLGEELKAHVERTCGGTDRAAVACYMGEQVTEDEFQENIFKVSYV
jgi:hypothetical protein